MHLQQKTLSNKRLPLALCSVLRRWATVMSIPSVKEIALILFFELMILMLVVFCTMVRQMAEAGNLEDLLVLYNTADRLRPLLGSAKEKSGGRRPGEVGDGEDTWRESDHDNPEVVDTAIIP